MSSLAAVPNTMTKPGARVPNNRLRQNSPSDSNTSYALVKFSELIIARTHSHYLHRFPKVFIFDLEVGQLQALERLFRASLPGTATPP